MRTHRHAFTLVELLVVLSILSLLIALLLPAIQTARESSRRAICQNNLHQIATALESHAASIRRYPYGGWGHEWVGVPGRGSGARQPGGWVYSILPYLELASLHELGANQTGAMANESYSVRLHTPISELTCPSRRACSVWDVASVFGYVNSPRPYGVVIRVARSDYAINGGSSYAASWPGPPNFSAGDDAEYWIDKTFAGRFSGVSHLHTAAKLNSFDDGFSKTYLVGEKMIDPEKYETGLSPGDNESMYAGYSNDLHRFAGLAGGSSPSLPPLPDGNENVVDPRGFLRFGSAHSHGFFMAFCDGSVRMISFDIDPDAHFRSGHRRDAGVAIEQVK
jgi:prepilin-type N-terminal cleavage/methylation domain-containing protein